MPSEPASFHESDRELQPTLESLSYASNYQAFLADLIGPHLRPELGEGTLEIGAGHGDLSARWAEAGSVLATDVSDSCLEVLESRFSGDARVSVSRLDITEDPLPPGAFGAVVMVNVLEHIDDDRAALADLRKVLVPDGRLVLFVPAFPLLYGEFDRAIGHHRRYRRHPLTDLLRSAGYTPEVVRYVNLPGFFAWLLTVRVLARNPSEGKLVATYDRWVMPLVRRTETRRSVPFGQSLLAVSRP